MEYSRKVRQSVKVAMGVMLVGATSFGVANVEGTREGAADVHLNSMSSQREFNAENAKLDSKSKDSYVLKMEKRVKEIGKAANDIDRKKLSASERKTLAKLKTKQREAQAKVNEVKTAAKADKEEKFEELSKSMSEVESLFAQLKTRTHRAAE